MPRDYNGKIMRQASKPDENIRMFHGSPNKITNGIIEARPVLNSVMGFEDEPEGSTGMAAAFATSDIHEAARYAGPKGHIYEVHEKPDDLNTNWGYSHGDLAYSEEEPLRIKQEVGRPGVNLARRMARNHFDLGHGESRK